MEGHGNSQKWERDHIVMENFSVYSINGVPFVGCAPGLQAVFKFEQFCGNSRIHKGTSKVETSRPDRPTVGCLSIHAPLLVVDGTINGVEGVTGRGRETPVVI